MNRLFPGLRWLEGYTNSSLIKDIISGLTIAAMLIPQSMGYALVAGLPAEFGLYACIILPLLYALLGTSNKISIGPVALDSILILSGLSVLADPGTDNYQSLAITLTLMVGVLQTTFGFLRFGFVANFLAYPVILGYTSAAAIIIMFSQVGNLVGVSIEGGNPFELLVQYVMEINNWHMLTLVLTGVGFAFMVFSKRWFPKLPSPLLLLVAGMAAAGYFNLADQGVMVINTIPSGLPNFALPSLSQLVDLIPVALTVALMGYIGTMSICKAQEKPNDKINAEPNQELIAVGVANLAGSLFRAFPVSASFSRSAAFVESGALTQVSAVVSSLIIALILLFLTPIFEQYPLPRVCLAVIIVVSVAGLFKYADMRSLFKQERIEFFVMFATFFLTLIFGVQQGIIFGVVLSIARVIYNTARPHMAELGQVGHGRLYRNIHRFTDVKVRQNILIFRFDAPLYFANVDYFVEQLYRWIKLRDGTPLHSVVFVAETVSSIDSSAIRKLKQVISNLDQQGITFYITNAIGPVRDSLFTSSLKEIVCERKLFATIEDAVKFIEHGEIPQDHIALQTNSAATSLPSKP